jgi:Glycosyl transferase family 2
VEELLSVVMPTHNRAGELSTAASSVLDQDVGSLELVIVNDASNDTTAAVLDELAGRDSRVRVVESPEALGPCEARNLGLEHAQGELVAFCDDDDSWLPGVGRAVLDFLDAHPDAGAASSWHLVAHAGSGRSAVFRGPLRFGAAALLWQNVIALPFAVVRRDALSFPVGFDPDLPTGEDWDLWLRCAQERPVHTVPYVGYRYTQHGEARVTRTADAQATGRRNFLAKHRASMSAPCRLYHESVLAGYAEGRRGMTRRLREAGVRRPPDAAFVGALLAASSLASRVGRRRGDPGLQARLMTAVVGRSAPSAGPARPTL